MWFEALLMAAGFSLLANGLLRRYRGRLLDTPNARSLHSTPTPRSGGIGMAIAMWASLALIESWRLEWCLPELGIVAGWLLVFCISLLDDLRDVSASTRLTVHVLAATCVSLGLGLPLAWWLLVVPGLVWATNLFNFMDGLDGLAGGQGLIGALVLLLFFALAEHGVATLLAAVLAGSLAGFLPWNLPRASLFLGDAGSAPTGFLLASLALLGVRDSNFDIPVIALPFLPFVLDATLTLLDRARRGTVLWRAHREHVYQRLVLRGIPVAQVLLLEWGLMLAGAGLAVFLHLQGVAASTSWLVLALVAGMMGAALEWCRRRLPVI